MFLSGRVKWFDKKKGYGFVESPKGDIFIHHSNFSEDFILNNNDMISFHIVDGEKGLKGENITKVGWQKKVIETVNFKVMGSSPISLRK